MAQVVFTRTAGSSEPGSYSFNLLLSQSFDDAVSRDKFGAPNGMSTFGYVSNSDEAGFLFGGILTQDGPTGVRRTNGSGASACKDALVSLTIKPQ